MADRSLFEEPFRTWTYESVDRFLNARIPEDERIEYKKDFTDTIQDSLVAFANGNGGYIFIGVEEVPGRKIPKTWPLLDSTKDNSGTVYNKAGSETSPVVRPQIRVVRDEAVGKEVVIAKVYPGDNPPYFAKQRGVKIRVGDTDIHADPRALENLFSRRRDIAALRDQPRQALLGTLTALATAISEKSGFILAVHFAPFVPIPAVRFGEQSSEIARRSATAHLSDRIDLKEWRSDDKFELGEPGRDLLSADRNGGISYVHVHFDPEGTNEVKDPIPLIDVAGRILGTALFAEEVYPGLFGYEGSLFTGIGLHTGGNRGLRFSDSANVMGLHRPNTPTTVRIWTQDAFVFRVGDSPYVLMREMIKSIGWRFGYSGYSRFVDTLGVEEERRRASP